MALLATRLLDFSEIPVIDLEAGSVESFASSLGRACQDVGFFYIANHGIDPGTIDALYKASCDYFSQARDEKEKCLIDQSIRGYLPLGYSSYEGEARTGVSFQEGFWVGYEDFSDTQTPLDRPNRWPDYPAQLKPAMNNYLQQAENLSERLLKGFALALGLEEKTFVSFFQSPNSRLKLNHYPPQEATAGEREFGVLPHSDSGAFTILWQDDNGGLEVQNKSGQWVGMPPMDGTLVVNIGNLMQIWSNGRFSSTPHRVINEGRGDRYSIPFFVNPSFDCMIEALVGGPSEIEPFIYGEYQRDLWRRSFPVANIPGEGNLDRIVLGV